MTIDATTRHQVSRIRRETRRRPVTVAAAEWLTPHLRRIRFASPELADFESAAPDDHVKLFVPAGAADAPVARDYTPRAFDPAAGTLVIDFAIHEAGPATQWALDAAPGEIVHVGGPRGSAVVADDFDWYLLVGDETALPAIARRIEELRPEAEIVAVIAMEDAADRLALPERPGLSVTWSPRAGSDEPDDVRLRRAIARLPAGGDGYAWIAAEAAVARSLRSHVVDTLGHPRAWTKAAGYWSATAAATHERIDD